MLKRGIIGVYHHITPKHTGRYVDEFAFRFNNRDKPADMFRRLVAQVSRAYLSA